MTVNGSMRMCNPFKAPIPQGLRTSADWCALPLPYRASRWVNNIRAVVFSHFDARVGISMRIHVHPSDCFKVLALGVAYTVEAVVMEEFDTGRKFETFAKWYHHAATNTYRVTSLCGDEYGVQGGYRGLLLPNTCYSEEEKQWMVSSSPPLGEGIRHVYHISF